MSEPLLPIKLQLNRRRFVQISALVSASSAFTVRSKSLAQPVGQLPPKFLADLDRCRPSSALSARALRRHWRVLDYETDQFQGRMLVAGENTAAPAVTYPLNRKGWHALYIGFLPRAPESWLQIRLKSDSTFSLIRFRPYRPRRDRVEEAFWKYADLTDEEIVLGQLCTQLVPEDPDSVGNSCHGVWVAYFKLVPLSDQEVDQLQKDRARQDTRRLFAHHDAWSFTHDYRPTTKAEIRREIEPFRNTDFARIYWEAGGGDRMYYPTRIGLICTDHWIEDPFRVGDRLASESWQVLRKKGIDPFRVALDYTHEVGLEFHASYRTAGFHFGVPWDEWNQGGLYEKHPEWRTRDRTGRRTMRLSYAYPQVRRFVVSLLQEMAGYPIDGVCLLYNRRPPILEYEPPLVESFQAKYGKDPRLLNEKDGRWLSHRASFLTQFMQELRAAMKGVEKQQKRQQPLEISAVVMGSRGENLFYGLDLEAWIQQKLVDTIIPYTSVNGLNSSADAWLDPRDAEYFVRITRGTPCKLAPNIMPRRIGPEDYRLRAHGLYEAGVEYLFFWDSVQRNDYSLPWDALRRLGHPDELSAWVRDGSPELNRPGVNLRRLGDWDTSYVNPG